MSFLNYSLGVEGPGQVVGDLDIQEHGAPDHFHFILIDVDIMSSIILPEVDDYLLRFTDIEGGIIVFTQFTRFSISFLYSDSSLFEIQPTVVESSANLKMELEGNLATQS